MDRAANWYYIKQPDQIDSPALVFYPERVKQNIRMLKAMIDDPGRLRPHIKTAKSREPVQLMMDAGIQKFKCATIAEAELLALCGAKDVLLAYQPSGTKLLRFINLIRNYPDTVFSCLVDNPSSTESFSHVSSKHDIQLRVYIDLNVGMDRTGIIPGPKAVELYETIKETPHLVFMGLHAYDGHIRAIDIREREALCNKAFISVEQLRQALTNKGFEYPLLIAGGSPTFQIHLQRQNTEVSPGTFIFWDWSYQVNIPEQEFLPAALVISRVVSLPAPGKICIDMGHKSIASESDLQHRVFFLNAPELKPLSHSEEHMVLQAEINHNFKIGDILYVLPNHICPTVALYDSGTCIVSGMIGEKWKIPARHRRINY